MKDDKMTIDQAYKELQEIVSEFEKGDIDLEKSIPKFKKGLELSKLLKDKLGALKVEVEEVKGKFQDDEN